MLEQMLEQIKEAPENNMITKLKDLVEKVDNMWKLRGNFNKKMEITKRSEMEMLEMTTAISERVPLMSLSAKGT